MTRTTAQDGGAHAAAGSPDLAGLLHRWTAQGLLTRDQADRILRAERLTVPQPRDSGDAGPPPVSQRRLLVEALAYLGGALALAAALLLLQLAWGDLPTAARLAVPTVAAAALVLGGTLVPVGPAGRARLRSALWVLGTGAWLGALAVLGDQVLDADGRDNALIMGLGGSALALRLYLLSRTVLQQAALLVPLVLVAAALAERATWERATVRGLAVWLVAGTWFALAERGGLPPRWSGRVLGAVGLVVGAAMTQSSLGGQAVALATVAFLFAWGVRNDLLPLLGVAAVGTLVTVPAAVTHFLPDEGRLVVPLVLLGTGLVLVAVAVSTTRSRGTRAAHGDGRRGR